MSGKLLTFRCDFCGAEFQRKDWRALSFKKRFCNARCYANAKSNAVAWKFWEKTDPQPNGCWHWMGTIDVGGYGTLKVTGKARKAHRHAWILSHGDISNDLRVLHRCDNRRCVNPDHLFLGTAHDNMRDMADKGRAAGFTRKGERHPMVKLSDENVREIRRLYVNRARYGNARQLCEQFQISMSYLGALVTGRMRPEAGGKIHQPRPYRRRTAA